MLATFYTSVEIVDTIVVASEPTEWRLTAKSLTHANIPICVFP